MAREWPNAETFEQMKQWLGDGEFDIDLMLSTGAITSGMVVSCAYSFTDSPWYIQETSNGVQNDN